jgi:uncharacterized LabA/DUF88 family protein
MSAAWFVDGAYAYKCWLQLGRPDNLDFVKLRRDILESKFVDVAGGEKIDEAYYFNSDPEPPTANQSAFYNALQYPPPGGPGLRVKLYWLQEQLQFWPKSYGGGPIMHPVSNEQLKVQRQKAVDVGLVFHLMRSYSKRSWTKLFLFAGDGDFYEPVQHLVENENVSLVLVGTLATISQELRPYAREIIEIDKVAAQIARARAAT